jgi:hypothetical protein
VLYMLEEMVFQFGVETVVTVNLAVV